MRRLLLYTLMASAATLPAPAPCMAQDAPATVPDEPVVSESATAPRIEFPVSAYDFGTQVAGEDLKTTFAFKNVGDAVLRILQVKGG